MSDPILPFAVWQSSTNQNSIPANDNALRSEILNGLVISESTDAQPGSPARGDIYIMTGAASGTQWATFDQYDLAIYDGAGTWHAYAPVNGVRVNVAGTLKRWNGTAYVTIGGTTGAAEDITYDNATSGLAAADVQAAIDELATSGGGSTQGKQAIYVSSAAMRPSATGGCAALVNIASASNQPDIQTLDFDANTQEYAQFSFVMPEKWNGGTLTFIPHWSHAATTTNFGVVWDLQAVAVTNDGAIAVAYGTAQTSTDTGGTTNDLYQGPESSAITVAGTPAGGQMLFFRVSRVTGNGSDTMAIDARLHGITVYCTTDADTDA